MLFSILLVWKRIDPACCIAMVFISLKVCLIDVYGSLNFVSRSFIDGACVVPLPLVVMTIRGSTFQPLLLMLLISGWYFYFQFSNFSCKTLSLQYVNSINWIVRLCVGFDGGSFLYGSPYLCPLKTSLYMSLVCGKLVTTS